MFLNIKVLYMSVQKVAYFSVKVLSCVSCVATVILLSCGPLKKVQRFKILITSYQQSGWKSCNFFDTEN